MTLLHGVEPWQTGSDFVGRQEELSAFRKALKDISAPTPVKPRLLHFYGTAGIGKSTLLREFRGFCTASQVAHARFSFEDDHIQNASKVSEAYVDVLYDILDDLRLDMKRFDDLLSSRTKWLLELDSGTQEQKAAAGQRLSDFPALALGELIALARVRPIVLFIDGIEDAPLEVQRNLEEELLEPFARAERSLIVSASRAPSPWLGPLKAQMTAIHLEPLEAHEVAQLVVQGIRSAPNIKISDNPLANYIYSFACGHPQVTLEVVSYVASLQSQMAESGKDPTALTALTPQQEQSLLTLLIAKYVKPFVYRYLEPEIVTFYESIAVARCFDESILNEMRVPLADREKRRKAVKRLEDRGLIYWRPGGQFVIDFLPRNLVLREMCSTRPTIFIQDTAKLVGIYQRQLKRGNQGLEQSGTLIEYSVSSACVEVAAGI